MLPIPHLMGAARQWPIAHGWQRWRRPAAIALELLPLAPFVVQFSPLTPSDEVSPLWVLALATGLGWAVAGRWRTGVLIAAGRVGVLWAGMYALLIASFSGDCPLGDPACDDGWQRAAASPILWAMAAFYFVTSVASAWLAQRAAAQRAAAQLAASRGGG